MPSSAVSQVTDATFAAEVLESTTPVLVEFGAEWCPPCRALGPVLERIAGERAGTLRVVSVDVDGNPLAAARYGAMSLPTMLVFAAGEVRARMVGYQPLGRLLPAVDAALPAAV